MNLIFELDFKEPKRGCAGPLIAKIVLAYVYKEGEVTPISTDCSSYRELEEWVNSVLRGELDKLLREASLRYMDHERIGGNRRGMQARR